MKLVEKINQKQALNYYRKKLELIHDFCLYSISLNEKQKEDVISVLKNTIRCCNKMKEAEYMSASYTNDKSTIINSKQQYNDYTIMKLMLNNLLSEVCGDEVLHQEKKTAVKKYVLSVFNHIRAKTDKYKKCQ